MPELKNYMELCVEEMLKTVLSDAHGCTCDNCKYDIMAITLNSLPPRYYVTKKGQLHTKLAMLQQQWGVDIIAAITKASEIVSENPRHDE